MSASWPMRTPISNLASPNMSPRTSLLLPHPLGPHPPLPLPLLLHRPTRITTNTRTTRYPQSLSGLLPLWLQAESFPHRRRTIRGCCPKQTNRSESSRSRSTRPKRRTRRTFLVQPAVLLLVSLTICATIVVRAATCRKWRSFPKSSSPQWSKTRGCCTSYPTRTRPPPSSCPTYVPLFTAL